MNEIQNIYDNDTFFSEYEKMRETKINANELLEIPMMLSLLPNLKEKRILDIGCGAGGMCRYFAEHGAKYVLGVDISKKMLEVAKSETQNSNVEYRRLAMEYLPEIKDKFDIVFSSLAFHYVEDFNKLMHDISNLLNPKGIFLFSQEHPVNTATILNANMDKKYVEIEGKRYYYLSDYNVDGVRNLKWNIDGVIKYHRSFSTIMNDLIESHFKILRVEESKPNKRALELVEKFKHQKDRPYFLFVKAEKETL